MEVAYTIGGGGFHLKKYQMEAAALIAGVPIESDGLTAGTSGVNASSTTASINTLGLGIDAVGASTLAQTPGAGELGDGNNASFVTVCINPDAVWRCKLNESATEDTALTIFTQVTASADGLAPAATIVAQATVWGFNGQNNGHFRMADATDSVLMAFPNAIAAGDEWLQVEAKWANNTSTATLTTLLTQMNANATVNADASGFIVVEWELRDISEDGRNNSFAMLFPLNHAFGNPGIIA